MTNEFEQIDIVDDSVAEILRHKSDAERIAMVDQMWNFAQDLIRANLRREHPDLSDDDLAKQTARRMSHGAV